MTTALASYTLAELKTSTQQLLGDINGTRFSSAQLTDAINYAIKQLCIAKGYTYTQEAILAFAEPGVQTFFPLSGTNEVSGGFVDPYDYMDYLKIVRVLTGGGWYASWDAADSYEVISGYDDYTISFIAPEGADIVVDAVYTPGITDSIYFILANGTETSTYVWTQSWTHDPEVDPCVINLSPGFGSDSPGSLSISAQVSFAGRIVTLSKTIALGKGEYAAG